MKGSVKIIAALAVSAVMAGASGAVYANTEQREQRERCAAVVTEQAVVTIDECEYLGDVISAESLADNFCHETAEETASEEAVILLARLTYSEAGIESDECKRLVIDTVLNRVDSEHFPDTIEDVIYQPKHFTPMWNGWFEECSEELSPDELDSLCEMVREELEERTNSDVLFFTAGEYSTYGEPMFIVDHTYFSAWKEPDIK